VSEPFRFSAFLRLLFESKVRRFSCLYKLDSFKDVICRRFKDSTVEDQPISPLAHEVRFAPKADKSLHRSEMTRCANRDRMQRSKIYCLFDHLVGAREQRRRYFEA
jgi:hypothetical protein